MNQIPIQIGPYKPEAEIGRGGMSIVYRAVDSRNGRQVALKVLPPEFAHNPTFLNRFVKEGENAVKLRHPNIVHTFEAGFAAPYYYMAMELAVEGTLSDRMKAAQGILPEVTVVNVLHHVAAGLDYAHTLGLLHRDIKPSNIMFTGDGRAVLADFGVAKDLLSEHTQVTMPGFSVGTPAYMSPEQARGDLDIDRRADIYSLGVVAYALLTGKMPFESTSQLVLLRKIVDDTPPLPEQVNPNIHPGAAYVLRHVLSKDPDTRYQTATEFVEQLAHALGQPRWDRDGGLDSTMVMIPSAGGRPPAYTPLAGQTAAPPKAYQPGRKPTPPPPYYSPSTPSRNPSAELKPAKKSNAVALIAGIAALLALGALALVFFVPGLLPSSQEESAVAEPLGQQANPLVVEPVTEPEGGVLTEELVEGPVVASSAALSGAPAAQETVERPLSAPTTEPPSLIHLSLPEDQADLADSIADFRWQFADTVAENEALELLFWPERAGMQGWAQGISPVGLRRDNDGQPEWQAEVDLLALDRIQGEGFDGGTYYWGVVRVKVDPYTRLDLESEVRLFSYVPQTQSSDADTPGSCQGALCGGR